MRVKKLKAEGDAGGRTLGRGFASEFCRHRREPAPAPPMILKLTVCECVRDRYMSPNISTKSITSMDLGMATA